MSALASRLRRLTAAQPRGQGTHRGNRVTPRVGVGGQHAEGTANVGVLRLGGGGAEDVVERPPGVERRGDGREG